MQYFASFKTGSCYSLSRWYHSKIDREEAEKILQPRMNGFFLVRDSQHFQGDYTLSVCMSDEVQHYRIINDKNRRLTIDEESYFNNLMELVEVCHPKLMLEVTTASNPNSNLLSGFSV